jgi:hypothetical protein
MSQPRRSAYQVDRRGEPYMFQQYALVAAVSPPQGSLQGARVRRGQPGAARRPPPPPVPACQGPLPLTRAAACLAALPAPAGGTLVTIAGAGFPDSSQQPGALEGVLVMLPGGAPCATRASNYTTLTCLTAAPGGPAAAAARGLPFRGWYPGMRGIQHDFLNRSAAPSQLAAVLGWAVESAGSGSYSSVLQGSFEGVALEALPHCTRFRAFFEAPRRGSYSFLMSADDWGFLNGTYHNVRAPRPSPAHLPCPPTSCPPAPPAPPPAYLPPCPPAPLPPPPLHRRALRW